MFDVLKIEKSTDPVYYIKTGIFEIDRQSGGIRDTDYIVMSGPTGTGKSYVAQWIAINAAMNGDKAMYVDMENGVDIIEERLTSFSLPFKQLIDEKKLLFFTKAKNDSETVKRMILDNNSQVEKFIFSKLEAIENSIILHKPKLLVIDLFSCLFNAVINGAKISCNYICVIRGIACHGQQIQVCHYCC